jgi:hypothetical protein
LKEAKAISVEIYGDSDLVIKQLNGQYECRNDILRNYYEECKEILKNFQLVILQHIPKEHNEETNGLAQSASGYRESQEVFAKEVCAFGSNLAENDWRKEIVDYLENPSRKVSRKLRHTGCYWPTMLEDCFEYYKGCQDCQKFGNIQRVPASALNPIIKPWPFR